MKLCAFHFNTQRVIVGGKKACLCLVLRVAAPLSIKVDLERPKPARPAAPPRRNRSAQRPRRATRRPRHAEGWSIVPTRPGVRDVRHSPIPPITDDDGSAPSTIAQPTPGQVHRYGNGNASSWRGQREDALNPPDRPAPPEPHGPPPSTRRRRRAQPLQHRPRIGSTRDARRTHTHDSSGRNQQDPVLSMNRR